MRHLIRVTLAVVGIVALAIAVLIGVQTDQHAKSVAAAARIAHARALAQREQAISKNVDDFRRFRLGAVAGAQLTPNQDDYAARTVANGPLLLFFPATGARPGEYRLFLDTAEDAGYHVLGLDYWNLGRTLSGTCTTNPRCYTELQWNRFNGSDSSSYSRVSPAGSITARFRDAITHLEQVDPAGGWNQFLSASGTIEWSHIVVAGHSQGGGMAAFIAHFRSVAGAIMVSSPVESDGTFHASWMDHPSATPVARQYAIDSQQDGFGPKIWGSWRVLGFSGAQGPWRTELQPPAVGQNPHAIITTYPFPPHSDAHSLIIEDLTPLTTAGAPRMLPLWHWLLTRFPLPHVHGARPTSPSPTPSAPVSAASGPATPSHTPSH